MESKNPQIRQTLPPSSLSIHSYSFSKSQRFPSNSKITPSYSPIRQTSPISKNKGNTIHLYKCPTTHNLTTQSKPNTFFQSGQGSVGKYRNYKKNKANPYQRLKCKSPRYKNHDNTSPIHAQLGGWPDSKRWFLSNKQGKKNPFRYNKEGKSPHRQNKLISQRSFLNKSLKKLENMRLTLNIQEINHCEIVGPGSYTIVQKQIGNYIDSRYKNNRGYSFGKSPRSPIKSDIGSNSPAYYIY